MKPLSSYKTLVFDCDGVILNSNPVKTQAFYNVALTYSVEAANDLVSYHKKYAGKSRYVKFDYFIRNILGREPELNEIDNLINKFAEEVKKGLMECEIAPGLESLRKVTPNSRWLVVSGGDQSELREVFSKRGLAELFDGGIFGSPDTKEVILKRELSKGNILFPAVLLGDSRYDYEVAKGFELDFVFVSSWTDFREWKSFFEDKNVQTIPELSCLTTIK